MTMRFLGHLSRAFFEGRFEIDPKAAAVVEKMFAWIDEEGLSCLGVMRRLNQLGIPTPMPGRASCCRDLG
jgi:hypothetical protein